MPAVRMPAPPDVVIQTRRPSAVPAPGRPDPDDDIASWSIDFDDGIVATGGWTTAPPNEVTHEYHPRSAPCSGGICNVTLTVTDSGGRTHTDTVTLVFVDATPD